MAVWCIGYPQFHSGDKIVSLVIHPPDIKKGTEAAIVSLHVGALYAVQLPDGELHRWFAGSELQPLNPIAHSYGIFQLGDLVKVTNDEGHPPRINKGMAVKIVKVIPQIPFYDLKLESGKYHRWLNEFEIIDKALVQK